MFLWRPDHATTWGSMSVYLICANQSITTKQYLICLMYPKWHIIFLPYHPTILGANYFTTSNRGSFMKGLRRYSASWQRKTIQIVETLEDCYIKGLDCIYRGETRGRTQRESHHAQNTIPTIFSTIVHPFSIIPCNHSSISVPEHRHHLL